MLISDSIRGKLNIVHIIFVYYLETVLIVKYTTEANCNHCYIYIILYYKYVTYHYHHPFCI